MKNGERRTAAGIGIEAVSFTGSQVGIITDTVHGKAKILEVKADRARQELGWVPKFSFEAGLARTLDWYRAGGHGSAQ